MRQWIQRMTLAAVASLTFVACGGDVTDIDRTQPDRLSKALFEGEWYMRSVVTGSDYNQSSVFEGLEGDMDRIRWVVDEYTLSAYRSYEFIENAESGNADVELNGNPLAKFRIVSHFDVMREYSKSTGEQSNVIVEDTTFRPWYEREFMRVDWGVNLIDSVPNGTIGGFLNYFSPVNYYVSEGEGIDNPDRVEVKEDVINVTNYFFMTPDPYICYYALQDWNCGGSVAKVRTSFLKVPETPDYDKLYYPDYVNIYDEEGQPIVECSSVDPTNCDYRTEGMFERFGFFRTQRQAYDDEFGYTYNNRIYLANRWNIWKKSFDDLGNLIPMQDREAGTIVYHTNPDFPEDEGIWNETKKIAADWDDAFRRTVAARKSMAGTPVSPDSLPSIYRVTKNTCRLSNVESYVAANGHEAALAEYGITEIKKGNLKRACAILEHVSEGDFQWQKQGDLRYSFFHWVDTPMQSGPLGYGPSAADPVTGEIISANANIYGASVDSLAAYAADIVQLMNDDYDLAQLIAGTYSREDVAGNKSAHGHDHHKLAQLGLVESRVSEEKLQAVADKLRGRVALPTRQLRPDMADSARKDLRADLEMPGLAREVREGAMNIADSKLRRFEGTHLDRELLSSDEFRGAAAGHMRNQPEGEAFSSIAWMLEDGEMMRQEENARRFFQENNILMSSWLDEGMLSVAVELQGKTWEEVYEFMRLNVYRAVQAHEVGHTIGLRHNFEGSYDPLNFHAEFWDYYNAETGKVERVDENGNPTRAERLMYSTIMDYDARFYADSFEGIGPYDYAAVAFGYGQMLEVFDHEAGLPPAWESLVYLHGYENIPKVFDPELECSTIYACDPNYINANDYYNDYVDAANAGDEPLADRNYTMYNRYINTYFERALTDATGGAEAINRISQRKLIPFEEWVGEWTDYWRDVDFSIPYDEVSYAFCPDEFSYTSNVTCQTWDKGATFTEITQDRALRHARYYYFTNFKRNSASFGSINGYLNRMQGRYFGPMSSVYRYYLYGSSGIGTNIDGEYLTLVDFPTGQDWQQAALEGLNYLNTVVAMPESGVHCKVDGRYVPVADDAACASGDTIQISEDDGRNLYTNWTDEYFYKATRMGTFWDKYIALWSMTYNRGTFYRDFSDYLDEGSFSLSYWRGLQDEMLGVFGGGYLNNGSNYSWYSDSEGNLVPKPVVDIYENSADYDALTPVDSSWTWTLRYWSILLPMARFNSMFDYSGDFSDYTRVCLKGYMDCMEFEDENGQAWATEFTDPLNGYTYVAAVDLDGLRTQIANAATEDEAEDLQTRLDRSVGALMLEEAQSYVDTVYTPAFDAWVVARDAYNADESEANATALRDAVVALESVERELNSRTSFIDLVRQFAGML